MKTLIINGSPRKNGDTAALLAELKRHLNGEITEISAYYDNIHPCFDCRACQGAKGCAVEDDMQAIFQDDFDHVVIASPVYMSGLTGPMISLASRFQAYYCAKRFLCDESSPRRKKAVLILVGGGDGAPHEAVRLAAWMFKRMNAHGFEDHTIFSLKTDAIPAAADAEAMARVKQAADYLNAD